ncbi:hypothetical protein NC653_016285 [Populus alba x Populus x berolinensis]|uniref:Uncharacterized protein n=1 Tax=Populus alba x Populus x berolinensis TaxID=444605 RepID=A0AAD6QMG3_9ROSI|nr:hypothetical protein NC653_016285 [Populus alba x Populus x berolinensis]
MNRILILVMWALVVAIPCQERGLQENEGVHRIVSRTEGLDSLGRPNHE